MTEPISHDDGISRIVVICFLPDMGHVLPLLRLVHFVRRHRQARVTCFLAPRFEALVREYGFDFHGLDSLDGMVNKTVFVELSRKSNFYNAFSGFAVLADNYWAPIAQRVGLDLNSLANKLRAIQPEFIIGDDHVFSDYYKMIADSCGARLVLHRSNGSLLPYQHPFVYAYGLSSFPSWVQDLVELSGRANRRIVRYWRLLSSPRVVRNAEQARSSLRRSARQLFGITPTARLGDPIRVTCGTGVFEKRGFLGAAVPKPLQEIFLPPLVVPSSEKLPDELAGWLSQQSRKIVYVSFGTLLCPDAPILRSLAKGLKNAGVAALWVLPVEQRVSLNAEDLSPENFFFADFLPQTALLFSGRVSCFVTHAGANSIHESLTAGVPMLCIPIIYDQHYNASVAVHLGSALRLSRRKINSDIVRTCVEEILRNPSYSQRAKELAIEINHHRDELLLSRSWVENMLQI